MAQIEKNGSYMALPMNIKRGNPIPVDTTMVWYSMTDLQEYAVSGATAYVGQIVTYVDEENSTVVAYMISNTTGTLIKLASTTASGDLAGDVATLQTQMANVLSTLEGLGALSTKDEITTAELAESLLNLINGKADSATTLAGYGIEDAYTKTEIDGKLSGAFHYKGMVDYYTELTAKTDAQQGDVYIVRYTGTSGTTPLNAEYAWTGEAWEEFGAIIDLSGYATKSEVKAVDDKVIANTNAISAINNENTGILAQAKSYTDTKDTATNEKVDANTSAISAINNEDTGILAQAKSYADTKKSEAIETAASDATTKANQALADAKEYVNGKDTAMDGRVSALETSITTKVENTKVATSTDLGLVKSSTANNDVSVDASTGVMTVNTITSDKISGSVAEADKLSSSKTISVSGDATGSASFDGSANADIAVTLKDSGVTAGTYTKVKVDAKGRVTEGSNITTADVGGAGDILTHNVSEFATAEQGGKADTAVQSVNVSGTTKTGTSVAFTKDELKANLGFIEATDDITFTNDVKAKATTKDSTDTTLTTKGYVDQQITDKIAASNAMVYKGTVGTDGTVTTLPTENVINGDTYKVVTDGEYAGHQAFVGDMFIAVVTTGESGTSISWTLIPSGDDGNVSTTETLTSYGLVIGKGNKEVGVLAQGTEGQILKADGPNNLAWVNDEIVKIQSSDSSITVPEPTIGTEGNYNTREFNLSINQVSTDKLIQGTNVLILDGGSASA